MSVAAVFVALISWLILAVLAGLAYGTLVGYADPADPFAIVASLIALVGGIACGITFFWYINRWLRGRDLD